MNKAESALGTTVEVQPPKQASALQLIITVTLRILGIRRKQLVEVDMGRMTPMQVGFACILALLAFTAIMALLAILAVKYMG